MADKDEVWGHANSPDSEHWDGCFQSRDECIEEALEYYEAGVPTWIHRGRIIRVGPYAKQYADAANLGCPTHSHQPDSATNRPAHCARAFSSASCAPGRQEKIAEQVKP